MPELADLVMSGEEILKLPKFTLNLSGILLCQALQLCHGRKLFHPVRHGPSRSVTVRPFSFSWELLLWRCLRLGLSLSSSFWTSNLSHLQAEESLSQQVRLDLPQVGTSLQNCPECWIIWICRDGCLLTIQFKTHASWNKHMVWDSSQTLSSGSSSSSSSNAPICSSRLFNDTIAVALPGKQLHPNAGCKQSQARILPMSQRNKHFINNYLMVFWIEFPSVSYLKKIEKSKTKPV